MDSKKGFFEHIGKEEYYKAGEIAMEEVRKNGGTYIVYMKDGVMVKEFLDGRIVPIKEETE